VRARASLAERSSYWRSLETAKDAAKEEEKAVGSVTLVGMLMSDAILGVGALLGIFGFAAAGVIGSIVVMIALPVLGITVAFLIFEKLQKKKASLLTGVNNLATQKLRLKHECPDCGYDLSGCRDAIETDAAHRVGPERCPECGAIWPLVLDATPDEITRWHRRWFKASLPQ